MSDPAPDKATPYVKVHYDVDSHIFLWADTLKEVAVSKGQVWMLDWTWRTFRVHTAAWEHGIIVLTPQSWWQSVKDRVRCWWTT